MIILITAGPTREAIDPVRYLSNHSSGKMGYALAEAGKKAGNRVILISGPTEIDLPSGVDFIPVESAREMYEATEEWIKQADIAIFAAAVSDYRPQQIAEQKIKKTEDELILRLIKNPDILAAARSQFDFQGTLIGFAAETENVIENARKKLRKKNCDCVIANDVSRSDIGFNSSENEITFVHESEEIPLAKAEKTELAEKILAHVLQLHQARRNKEQQSIKITT